MLWVMLTDLMNMAQQYPENDEKWLIFDGPINLTLTECLSPALGDNRKLCLANSDTVALSERHHLLFEVFIGLSPEFNE